MGQTQSVPPQSRRVFILPVCPVQLRRNLAIGLLSPANCFLSTSSRSCQPGKKVNRKETERKQEGKGERGDRLRAWP